MRHQDPESAPDATSIFAAGLIGAGSGADTEVARGAEAAADAAGDELSEPLAGVEALSEGKSLLVVKRGPNAGSRYELAADMVTAGRHPDSDIFLDDVSVSRRHAEFRRSSSGFEVVDVGSLNGTYVNRDPIESSPLSGGDEVQIGKFRLVYLTGPGPAAGAGPAAGS